MSKEHPKGNYSPAWIGSGELRHHLSHRLLKLKLATLIQEHACESRSHYLGDGGQIVDCFGRDDRGLRLISETPETFAGNQPAVVRDCNRSAGEGSLLDSVLQYG